jgi:hypothetical protein
MTTALPCANCHKTQAEMAEVSGTWTNDVKICPDCITRIMEMICYSNPVWFEEKVAAARVFRPSQTQDEMQERRP